MDGMAGHAGAFGRLTHRRPHAALEWDSCRKKVVAPKSQVGLSESQSSRDGTSARFPARLIDSFDVPKELLQLPDLSNILSWETWEKCLSEPEREFLSTYLPEGFNSDYIVEALSAGENFHFGNPLQDWGEAVCSGATHPDNILKRELQVKQERNDYFKRLSNYHGNMLQNLQKLKDVWEDCAGPDDFLSHIHRGSIKAGLTTIRGNGLGKHAQRTLKWPSDVAFPRVWVEGDGVPDKANHFQHRSKPKKSKVKKVPEGVVEPSRARSTTGEIFIPTAKSVEEGPKKKKSKPASDSKDVLTRPHVKGGSAIVHQQEHIVMPRPGTGETKKAKTSVSIEGSKKRPVGPSGAKRLTIKPLEEGTKRLDLVEEVSKRVHAGQLNGGVKRPTNKPSEFEGKGLQVRLPNSGNKKQDIRLMANDEIKGSKSNSSEKGARRLKIKPSGETRLDLNALADETVELNTELQDDELRRLHWQPRDEDLGVRPKGKRQTQRASEEVNAAPKISVHQRREPATKKLHIKMDKGRPTMQINPSEGRDALGRSKGKKEKPTPPDEAPTRQMGMVPDEGVKKIKIKSSTDALNVHSMDSSKDASKVLKNARSGVKKPSAKVSGGQRSALKSEDTQEVSPGLVGKKRKSASLVPEPKRQKNKSEANGKDGGNGKLDGKGNTKIEIGGSDFEGEWFKKYVQVAIGPVSGQKISKAVQPVKVSSVLFQDVKRRTQAGEEVHLETWHPELQQVSTKSSVAGKESKLISKFWQGVARRDVPVAYAAFMKKASMHQKTATNLALDCADLLADRGEPALEHHDHRGKEWVSDGDGSRSPGEESGDNANEYSGREVWSKENADEAYQSGSEGYVGVEPGVEGGEASGSEEEAYVRDGQGSGSDDAWVSGEDPLFQTDNALHRRRPSWTGAEELSDRREGTGDENVFFGGKRLTGSGDGAVSGDEEDMAYEAEESPPNEGDNVLYDNEAGELRLNGDESPRGSEDGLQAANEFLVKEDSPSGVESLGNDRLLEGEGSAEEDGLHGLDRSFGRNGSNGGGGLLDGDRSPRGVELLSSDNEASDYEVSPNREGFRSEDEVVASGDDDGMSSGADA